MQIPYDQLPSTTLRTIVQEFVTRDGTDYSDIETRIRSVTAQLQAGVVEIHFDSETGTCNIIPKPDPQR